MKQKSMTSNFIYNLLYNGMNILFPLVTIPYVSRVLLAGGVGRVGYAQNIVTYFLIIAQLGIPKYGIREIAKVRDHSQDLSQTFFEIFSINAISTTIALIAYYGMIFILRPFPELMELYAVAGLTLAFNYINCDWLYTGLEEYKYITVRNSLVKLCSLLLIFLFVRDTSDVIPYALIYCIGIGGNHIFNLIQLRRYVRFPQMPMNCLKHLAPIFVLLSTNLAVELYTQLDTTMTGMICGEECVGYYTNTVKLTRLVVTVITTVGAVLLPRLSYYYKTNDIQLFDSYVNKAFKILLFFSVPAMIGAFLMAEPIILIVLGDDFVPSINTLRILSILMPILAVGNLFGSQILLITDQETKLMKSVIVGAVVNILLNAFLIPRFQQNGAALGSVIAEFTVMALQTWYARKAVTIRCNGKFWGSLVISNVFVAGLCCIISAVFIFNMFSLVAAIALVGMLYVFLAIFLKNEVAVYLLTRCKNIITDPVWRKRR